MVLSLPVSTFAPFAQELCSDLHLCTFLPSPIPIPHPLSPQDVARIARSAIPTCIDVSTFPQAVGRFALLHGLHFLRTSPRAPQPYAIAFRNSAIAALPASIAIALASVTELRCA